MTDIRAPSTCLPPLKRVSSHSACQMSDLLDLIQTLYQPDVRGTGSESQVAYDSGYASDASDQDQDPSHQKSSLELLRQDRYERSNAIKWLVGFIARAEEWVENIAEDSVELEARAACIEHAVKVLATCSGTSASGPLTRTFEFSRRSEDPVVVHLRDAALLSQDHTSVGLQTWGSSCILTQKIVSEPAVFGLSSGPKPLRILELGAGTGLLSIALSKLLADANAQIVATDFHPAVLENLRNNVSSNFFDFGDVTPPDIQFLDWRHLHDMVLGNADCILTSPFNEPFDIIFGTDIIYEPHHTEWIRSTVQLLLARDPAARFHLIMPARPTHETETAAVPIVFPLSKNITVSMKDDVLCEVNDQLIVREVQEIDRLAGTGRMDEVHYLLYNIGWNMASM